MFHTSKPWPPEGRHSSDPKINTQFARKMTQAKLAQRPIRGESFGQPTLTSQPALHCFHNWPLQIWLQICSPCLNRGGRSSSRGLSPRGCSNLHCPRRVIPESQTNCKTYVAPSAGLQLPVCQHNSRNCACWSLHPLQRIARSMVPYVYPLLTMSDLESQPRCS